MRWTSLILFTFVLCQAAATPAQEPAPQAPQGAYLTPADICILAYADALTLPPQVSKHCRWIALMNLPAPERTTWHTILNGHCNGLSSNSELVPLYVVPGAGGHLLRVNLLDYGWKAATWEQFSETDHTFSAVQVVQVTEEYEEEVEKVWPGGADGNGKHWPQGHRYKVKEKRQRVKDVRKATGPAPWLYATPASKAATDGLIHVTGSQIPVVNAFVFLDNTGTAGDARKPDYYEMLGVRNEADFHRLVGIDIPASAKFSTDLMAAVGQSGVTQEPRAIQRFDKIGGALWRSLDVAKGTAKDRKNALRAIGSDAKGTPELEFAATEQYGHLPNGLWAFLLANNRGEKQATAPDNVAGDVQQTTRNNHAVRIGVSCIRCHSNGGLQDITDFVRNFPPELDVLPKVDAKDVDYEEARRRRRQYARKLEPFLKQDRERYEAALLEITGLTSQKYAAEYARLWTFAADAPVDLEYAARELGCTPERLQKAVAHQVKAGKADPVVAVFVLPAAKRKPLPIGTWRESYGLMQTYLKEYDAHGSK